MKKTKKSMLLAASVTGLLAVAGMVSGANAVYAGEIACSGINACKGAGWVHTDTAEACTSQGGTVVAGM